MIKLSATLALFIFCWVPLTHAASNEGQNRGGSAAVELSLQTRHYAEKSRAKRILTDQSHSNEIYYSQMIETLLALSPTDRTEVIQQISALPARAAALASEQGPHRSQLVQFDDHVAQIATFSEFLEYLRHRRDSLRDAVPKRKRNAFIQYCSIGAITLGGGVFICLPGVNLIGGMIAVGLMGGGFATLLTSSQSSSDHDERIQKWIATQNLLTEITTTIAKNTVFMNFLRERALLSGQGTVEARNLLNTLNSCSRLLGAARTE